MDSPGGLAESQKTLASAGQAEGAEGYQAAVREKSWADSRGEVAAESWHLLISLAEHRTVVT